MAQAPVTLSPSNKNTTNPNQITKTPAWTGNGVSGGQPNFNMQSFAQIVEQEKANRNILEIKIIKIMTESDRSSKPQRRGLTFDEK